MKTIYLDYAAATPLDKEVLAAMQPYFGVQFYNPSATYLAAQKVQKALADARAQVAEIIGARPSEIIFTAGGTEANNLAIRGVMEQFTDSHMVVSGIEHESVLAPAKLFHYTEAPVKPDGLLDLVALERAITEKTVLVSIMYANNEIGTIQPLQAIAQLLKEIQHKRLIKGNKRPLYFHTDACQAPNYLHVFANRLGVDMMTLNGGKIYGPKQSGVLFVKSRVELQPLILGGGQERGLRSGTENVANSMGFSKALRLAADKREAETKRLGSLQKLFLDLLGRHIPGALVNGSMNRLVNNIHATFPGADNERLIFGLDEHGVQTAAGSACSASKEESSHVLKALGLSDKVARSSLRFSMGRGTTEADVRTTVKTLAKLA